MKKKKKGGFINNVIMNHKNLLKTGKNLLKGGRSKYTSLLWVFYILLGLCIVGIIIHVIVGIINMIKHWNAPPPPKLNENNSNIYSVSDLSNQQEQGGFQNRLENTK